MRIAVVAPSCPLRRDAATRAEGLAAAQGVELVVHPQCFLEDGHFAGPDADRLAALREVMADPAIDAVWFARGGYGACRLLDLVMPKLTQAARTKTYLGYSVESILIRM